jgi:hypothetical protein
MLSISYKLLRRTKEMRIVLLCFILAACSAEKQKLSEIGGGISFKDPNKMTQLLHLIKSSSADIDWELRDDTLYYSSESIAEINRLSRILHSGETLNPSMFETISIESDKQLAFYKKQMALNNIPFSVTQFNGIDLIIWSQTYAPKMDQIQEDYAIAMRSEWIDN